MQGDSEVVSFLIMVAVMFFVTILDALGRRRKKQEEMEAMAEAERRGGDGLGDLGSFGDPGSLDPPSLDAPSLDDTELGSVAEEIREESRRELRELEEAPPQLEGPLPPPSPHPEEDDPRSPLPARAHPPTVARRGPGASAGLVASLLDDPEGLRKAVLYREILGPPLASRRESGGWEDPIG